MSKNLLQQVQMSSRILKKTPSRPKKYYKGKCLQEQMRAQVKRKKMVRKTKRGSRKELRIKPMPTINKTTTGIKRISIK